MLKVSESQCMPVNQEPVELGGKTWWVIEACVDAGRPLLRPAVLQQRHLGWQEGLFSGLQQVAHWRKRFDLPLVLPHRLPTGHLPSASPPPSSLVPSTGLRWCRRRCMVPWPLS